MRHVPLDGNETQNKEDVHVYLKNKLDIKGYHGNNLDALWDVLSTYSQPIIIELIHSEQMLKFIGAYGQSIISVFEDAAKENLNITFRITDTRHRAFFPHSE